MKLCFSLIVLVVIGVIISILFVEDVFQKLTLILSVIVLLFVVLQTQAAVNSAKAAQISASSAESAHKQAVYIHLANLWYEIKKKGLENSLFINPDFCTLFRQKEILDKYLDYHIYAWLCWGHAEDCFRNKFHTDAGFKPSISNYKELHYAWLIDKNEKKFDKDFIKWVKNELLIPDVEVKSGLTIQGKGVFAKREFSKGDFIGFFDGNEVEHRTQMSLQFSPIFHIEPSLSSLFKYLNHSCDANTYFRGRNLYAFSRITVGQEITIDYNCHEYELSSPFECNCGSTGCVKKIEGFRTLTHSEKEIRKDKITKWLISDDDGCGQDGKQKTSKKNK